MRNYGTPPKPPKKAGRAAAREVELALPLELEGWQAIALAREFVQQEFIQRGMIADLPSAWAAITLALTRCWRCVR